MNSEYRNRNANEFIEKSTSHSKRILPKWVEYGGMLKPIKRNLKHHSESVYYRGSLHKFFAFLLHDAFDRVVLMDADGIPVSNLDHLFLLPMPKNVSLAAPQAYWFNDFGSDFWDGGRCPGHLTVAVASVLLLVVPSEELFLRVEKHFGTKSLQRENFDMDIINMEFTCKGEILVLPKMYGTLNSEYSAGDSLSKRVAQCKNFSQVRYMHFSADGKPWSKRREAISYRGMYPDKEVADLHIEWHKLAKEACPLMNLGL